MKVNQIVLLLVALGALVGCATTSDYVSERQPEEICSSLNGQWDRGRQARAVTIQANWVAAGCSIAVRAQNPIDGSDNTSTLLTKTPQKFRYRASNVGGGGFDDATVVSAGRIDFYYRNGTGYSGSGVLSKVK